MSHPAATPMATKRFSAVLSAQAGGLSFINMFSRVKKMAAFILRTCSGGGVCMSVSVSIGTSFDGVYALPHARKGVSRYWSWAA
jgi:hypothetical protein